jgi:hypothetical protein
MAEIDKPSWLYPKVALSAQEIADINRYDPALGGSDRSRAMLIPSSTFLLDLTPAVVANNSTEVKAVVAPFDFQIGEISVGCEAAAGSAATADVKVGATAAAAASILDAAEDIKTGVPEPTTVRPETDKDVVSAGQVIVGVIVGTGAGAVDGASIVATCKRL